VNTTPHALHPKPYTLSPPKQNQKNVFHRKNQPFIENSAIIKEIYCNIVNNRITILTKPHLLTYFIAFMTKSITQKTSTKQVQNLKNYFLSCTKPIKQLACLLIFLFSSMSWGQSTANYNFTFGASTLNAMTGSTSLMTGVQDDTGSTVFPIGFNFIYMGNVYSHISVNSNGQVRLHTSSGATAIGGSAISSYSSATVTIAPMAGDNQVGNGMSYLVTGSAPNRKLIIEWNKFYVSLTDVNSGNMQLVLYEGTGVFEFIYGNIVNSASGTRTRSIFHSSGSTANLSAFISVGTTPTINTSATSPTDNTFAASVAISNLANRTFTFTPNVTSVAGPTNLTFASVTATSMTLNWTAASPTTGIVRYVVQRSTDGGVTFPVNTNVALGTNTLALTGLSPGTNYTFRVVAVSEGVESTGITGSQATPAGATYFWVGATGGLWNTFSNWNTAADGTGATPTAWATTDVHIIDGAGTTAGGNLSISVDRTSFTLGQFRVTSNTNLTLASSATTIRTLTISGGPADDFMIENGSTLNLTNATNHIAFAFSGTGNTGDISGTYNAGGSTNNTITTTGGTGTLVTVSATGVVNNAIAGSSGCLTGSAATLSFANGSNYNHSGFTTACFIPTSTWGASSNVTMSGSSTSAPTITGAVQSFGNLTFNLPTLTGTFSVFTTSTVTIQGNLNVSVPTGIIFRATTSGTLTVNGNLNINSGTFQHASSSGIVNVLGNTTINSGTTLDLSATSGTFSQRGATFTNNGTIIGSSGTIGAALNFFSPTNAPLAFAGSGTVSSPLISLGGQTTGGITISHTNQIPVLRVNLFTAPITNSNKLTIGTGAALACTVQIGSVGSTFPGGSFDQSPTWSLGTGTLAMFYAQTSTPYSTGFEVPPTRTVTNATISNTSGLTITGGNLDVTTTLTMTAGVVTTSTGNVLGLRSAGTLSGTPTATNMVNGPFNRTYAASRTASGTYSNTTVLPVGKGGVYTPIFIDPATTAGGAVTFTGEAFTANSGTIGSGVSTLASTRYEAVTTTGAANLTSAFVRLTDASVVAASKLLQASSAAGSYESLPLVTNFATGTLTTATAIPAASYTGFLSFGEVTPCTAPADQATAVLFPVKSTTSLTASYTAAASNPTGYLVVRTASGTPATNPVDQTNYTAGATALGGTIAYVGAALTFNQTGLIANTTYDYTIFSYNNSGCAGPVYNTSTPTTATVTTCATVTGTPGTPTLSNNATTSFTASWTASSTAGVNYIIDVATNSGFTTFVSGYQALNVGTVLTTNITGLTAATPYWVRVRADLSGCISSNSSSLAVTTQCNPITALPWAEGFESVTTGTTAVGTSTSLPNCWTSQNTKWSTSSEVVYNNANTGTKYLRLGWSSTNAFIWSPGFELTAGVSYDFSFFAQGDGGTGWNADVFVNSTQSSTGATQLGAAITPAGTGTLSIQPYNKVTRTFVPSTTGTYYFTIRGNQASSSPYYMAFDDFKLELTPTCLSPTALTISSITNNSASLSWTAPASAPGSGYDVYYSTTNTAPTAGTTPSDNVPSGTTYAYSGLTASTTYYSWVRSNCGSGDVSTWVASASFTTQCNPLSVPYSQDFESVTTPALPICTSIQNAGTGNNWKTASPPGYGFTTKCLNYSYNSTNAANAWFFTAGINLTAGTSYRISYNYGTPSTTDFPENLKVAYGVSALSTSMTTTLATHTNILDITAPLSTVDFTPGTTGVYYFGFNAFSDADMNQLYVDNISIKVTPNTWTGTTSNSWNTASNWSLTTVPTATDDVLISSNGSNAPVMDVDVTIPAGKNLTLTGGELTIAPGKVLTIAGTANFGGRPVTFESNATGTAMLGTLTGTLTGATNVKVERYIPSGKRAFRLLSPAVTTTTFISGNWQGQTHITGGASGGFDATETNNPSMYTYNNLAPSGTGWTAIANTNNTNLTAGVGYRVLIRGDRNVNLTVASQANMNAATTLSATGTLRTGTVTLDASSTPAINNTANTTTLGYSLVGNPYQSAVDWNAVTRSGIDATYWAWDPNMGTGAARGNYVAFNVSTGTNNVDSQVGRYIQPGQAFFVMNTTLGTAGTLTFQEAHKATTSANVFRTANETESANFASLSVQLYDPNELAIGGYPIDATKAVFSSAYTNELGLGDATKLEAAGENIAWFRNNTKLAIDAAAPVTTSDELAMKTIRLGANKNYTFKIQTTNFDTALTPYLVDTFLNTQTEIATSQAYLASFATTSNVASYSENRFKIVFQNALLNTDTFATQVGLYPNPSKGNGFYLQLPSSAQATVRLYNTLGQEIAISHNEGHYQANQSLAAGVYHIMVTQGEKTSKLKWIVE
jgi:hypothetical protein